MKKNRIIYLFIIVLLILAGYYFINTQSGTLGDQKGAKSNFAIKDISSIDKIFIVDAQGQQVTLIKLNDQWTVNGEHKARPHNIELLLKTFKRIAVKYPVPRSAFKTIVKNIATNSIKIEIYQGKSQPTKIYYIGSPTMDHQGTYMLLEEDGVKSTVPYVTHIPGFRGFLHQDFLLIR